MSSKGIESGNDETRNCVSCALLPARASEQGNVIGLVSVYIYIYIYVRSCHQ